MLYENHKQLLKVYSKYDHTNSHHSCICVSFKICICKRNYFKLKIQIYKRVYRPTEIRPKIKPNNSKFEK